MGQLLKRLSQTLQLSQLQCPYIYKMKSVLPKSVMAVSNTPITINRCIFKTTGGECEC